MKKVINMVDLMKRVSKVAVNVSFGAVLCGSIQAEAANYTWEGTLNSDLDTAGNWMPNGVPGSSDTAIFSSSALNRTPTLESSTYESLTVSDFDFVDATQFNFTIGDPNYYYGQLSFDGAGIINEGGAVQTFSLNAAINFNNSSSASNAEFITLSSRSEVDFNNNSHASNATIYNSQNVFFNDLSSADSSHIIASNGSSTNFYDTSNGGNSLIELNASKVFFSDTSTPAAATINADNQSEIFFRSSSTIPGTGTFTLTNMSTLELRESFTLGPVSVDSTSSVYLNDQNPLINPSVVLSVNSTKDSIIAGPITDNGYGSLVKTGPGTLYLNGVNNYTLGTTVEQGNLSINNFTAGNVFVNGGILSGIGTIGGNLTNNNATVSPGNSIGTLTILGNYIQNGGIYVAQINGAGESSLLNISGTATLSGSVEVTTPDGTYNLNDTYTILTADGGLNNTKFASAFSLNPVLIPLLSYSLTDVFLNLKPNFANVAVTANQRNIANQLDSITDPTVAQAAVLSSIAASPNVLASLDSLAGLQYTHFFEINQYEDHRFLRRIFASIRDLLSPCPCDYECGFQTWAAFEGGRSITSGRNDIPGFKSRNYDGSLGVHFAKNHFFLGLAGSFEYDHLNFDYTGSANINTGQGAIYGGYASPFFYAFSNLIVGASRANFHRDIFVGETYPALTGTSHFTMTHGDFYTEAGVSYRAFERLLLQPFVGFDVDFAYRDAIHEENSLTSFDYEIHKKSLSIVNTYLGAHFTGNYNCLQLQIDLAWQYRCTCFGEKFIANFADFGTDFPIVGYNQGRNGLRYAALLSTDAKTPIGDQVQLYVEFSGEYWSHWFAYNVAAGFKICW